MTLLAVLCALAVALWPGPAPPPRPPAGPPDGGPADTRRSRGPSRPGGWWRRRRVVSGDWVADLAEVTAVGLRAGLGLERAVRTAAAVPAVAAAAPWLPAALDDAARVGAPVAEVLAGRVGDAPKAGAGAGPLVVRRRSGGASADEAADLGVLVRAWRLSEHLGAPASDTTATAAAVIRERRAAAERAAAVVAGPRASMRLLTALPLLGPAVGLLLGIGPGHLYGSTPARVGAVLGVLLTALGWWWGHRLLARGRRSARTGVPS